MTTYDEVYPFIQETLEERSEDVLDWYCRIANYYLICGKCEKGNAQIRIIVKLICKKMKLSVRFQIVKHVMRFIIERLGGKVSNKFTQLTVVSGYLDLYLMFTKIIKSADIGYFNIYQRNDW